MNRHYAGKAKDVAPGEKVIVEVGGRSIGVYNVKGQYHAIRNLCPHQGAPLCKGPTTAYPVSSAPGDFSFERDGEIVRCPWHAWEFDIKSGCLVVDPKVRTKIYEVEVSLEKFDVDVENGELYIIL
ncbi:Rieske (2Fe-2S) protein [Paenibacillus ferrarius]|uniref:Rieske (2Fe-2S) protein n=1 Tax=Paenibacillus ferrarius TaxID=1469647 RepID=UPI003D2B572E